MDGPKIVLDVFSDILLGRREKKGCVFQIGAGVVYRMVLMENDFDSSVFPWKIHDRFLDCHFHFPIGFFEQAISERTLGVFDLKFRVFGKYRCEIHDGPVDDARTVARAQELPSNFLLLSRIEPDKPGAEKISGKYLFQVRIERKGGDIVCESPNRLRGIGADARERPEFRTFSRKYPPVIRGYDFRAGEQIAGSGIVPESLVIRKKGLIIGERERLDGRKSFQNPFVESDYPVRLGLLEKYFGQPDAIPPRRIVQMVEMPPGKVVSAMFRMPSNQFGIFKNGKQFQ